MSGSWIAENIEREMKREQYYKNKKRAKCVVEGKKQCTICKYQKICENGRIYNREDIYVTFNIFTI